MKAFPNDSLVNGFPRFAADESEFADRTRIERALQDRQDRQSDRDLALALFSAQRGNAVADMLAADPDRIAATQASVEQNVAAIPALACQSAIACRRLDIGLGPFRKPGPFLAFWILRIEARVDRYMLRRSCPPEQATHGIEVVAGLRWCMSADRYRETRRRCGASPHLVGRA